MFRLSISGQPVSILLSCLGDGDTGGGLVVFDGAGLTVIDRVSTTGMSTCDGQLVRMLWAPSQTDTGTTIVHYDRDGIRNRFWVPGLVDPHDMLWTGSEYVAVSSLLDSVLWIDRNGVIRASKQFASGQDCWHLNCLASDGESLYATCFGRFDEPRAWKSTLKLGTGVLFDLERGTDVVGSLCCPHSPRQYDGEWAICCSSTSELRFFKSGATAPSRTVVLKDWVRGLLRTDHYYVVGESVNRLQTEEVRGATVAFLDRVTLECVGRITLPFRAVYDIVPATEELLAAIKRSSL